MAILRGLILRAHAQLTRRLFALAGLFALLGGALPARADDPGEYEIKAAFLFNFAKFVEWPEECLGKTDPIRIGVLGRGSPLSDIEKTVVGKKIDEHAVSFENYQEALPASPPHILFILSSDAKYRRILADLGKAPVLTVGEVEGFCEAGGIINFKREGRKFRFEINPKAAERHKLKLSSKLIGVALRLVETSTEP